MKKLLAILALWPSLAFAQNLGSPPGIATGGSGGAFGTFAFQNFATPPAIGGTTPSAITATNATATSAVIVPLGSISSASVQLTGNANTGFFFASSGEMDFMVGGSVPLKVFNGSLNIINAMASGTFGANGIPNAAGSNPVCITLTTSAFSYSTSCTVSDERLKNIQSPINHAVEKLLQIRGFNFTYKDPDQYGRGPQIGVGAQTVARVFPEIVHTDSNGIENVDYGKLTAPIIEAIREQQACLDSWKCRIFGWK